MFTEASQMSPEDADVHVVLGVLYNLSREYDKAVSSLETALKLKPQDYSLWNKLGATQANSVQSADAILAYQKVHLILWLKLLHINLIIRTNLRTNQCQLCLFLHLKDP